LAEAEQKLADYMKAIQAALEAGNYAEVSPLCRKAELALMERNNLCKLNRN
jgi:hypothetical protein